MSVTLSFPKQSRTPATDAQYRDRAKKLLARYNRETGRDWAREPVAAAEWLAGRRSGWSKNAWKQYRNALKHYFEAMGFTEAYLVVDKSGYDGCLPRGQHTSAKKQKGIPDDEYQQLIHALANSRSKYAVLAALWLQVGITFGSRPIEWWSAHLNDEGTDLTLDNAKHTNGRAFGPTRTIKLLEHFTETDLEALDKFLRLLRQLAPEVQNIEKACQQVIRNTAKRLWPRRKLRPTIYSARHQFAADAKSSGLTDEEVAALMGHASKRTAKLHYARSTLGRGGIKVRPSEGNVASVRALGKDSPTSAPPKAPQADSPRKR